MARCQWCTAPLPPRSSVCRYCGRRSDVDLRGVHEFTVAVPASPRVCPACEIPMQTVDLHLGGTFYIERCEKCLSLFFDPNEVETVLEKSAAEAWEIDHGRLDEAVRGAAGAPRERIRYYKCPVCRTAMNRVNFGARSGVIVDRCPAHGVWLEAGELRSLLEWRRAGGQVLDRRRREERLREEREREARRVRDAAAAVAASGPDRGPAFDLAADGLGSAVGLTDAVEAVASVVRAVTRLFR
jgi:Zn-finger nucleic acid-binding protein